MSMPSMQKFLIVGISVLAGVGLIWAGFSLLSPEDPVTAPVSTETAEVVAEVDKVIGIIQVNHFLDPYVDGLKAGMTELGYRDGEIEYLYDITVPGQRTDIEIAEDYAEAGVDAIFTLTATPMLIDRLEELDVPTVFVGVDRPVETGLVESYRSSGKNITGIENNLSAFVERQLEFLARIHPEARTIGVFTDGFAIPQVLRGTWGALEHHAPRFGFEIREYTTDVPPPQVPGEFERVAAEMEPGEIDAIFHLPGHFHRLVQEVALSKELGIIHIAVNHMEVEGGGYFAFNADYYDVGRQAAAMMDKILQGVHPADIPIESPNNPFLSVNRETIEAVGIPLPPAVEVVVGREYLETNELLEH